MKSVIDNRRWAASELWHYVEVQEGEVHKWGFWVLKDERSFRFWCSTPSAAYWLAANLNEHLVGEEITHRVKRRREPNPNEEWHPMRVYS